jgi:microcystin-dependent protein
LGQSGGAATVTLLAANLPPHTHPVAPPVSNVNATSNSPVNGYPAVVTATTGARTIIISANSYANAAEKGKTAATYDTEPVGGSAPVSITPPFQTVNYIIAASAGSYPPRPS